MALLGKRAGVALPCGPPIVGIGIDLGGFGDLSALCVVGEINGDWLISARTWCTETDLDGNVEQRSILDDCIDDGDLFVVNPGADLHVMMAIVSRAREKGNLHAVGIDPNGASDFGDMLEAEGYSLAPERGDVIGIGQSSLKLNAAVQTTHRRLEEGRLIADNSRLLRWQLGNVTAIDRGHVIEIARRTELAKIDAVAALLDAVSTLVLRRPTVFDVGAWIG